jgi:hypothetical protein
MSKVAITGVIDGETLVCTPSWEFGDESGNRIRPVGYEAPDVDDARAALIAALLTARVEGKTVDLVDPVKVDGGWLLCTVLVDGIDLAYIMSQL